MPAFNLEKLLQDRTINSTEDDWVYAEDCLSFFSTFDLILLTTMFMVASNFLCRVQTKASESVLKIANEKTGGVEVSLTVARKRRKMNCPLTDASLLM